MQFSLQAAPTTTTTTTYAPPVWQSLSDGSVSYAGLNLDTAVTFGQITNLSANYAFTQGDCAGGSLRWTLYLDNGGLDRTPFSGPLAMRVLVGFPISSGERTLLGFGS